MSPYTLDNNLTFSYNSRLFDWKTATYTRNPSFDCTYAKATRKPKDFRTECQITSMILKEQAASLNRTPRLMLSGGLDSHVVAMSMIEAGLDVNAITYRFANDFNHHEMALVEAFAKRHNIDVEYVDIDVHQWMMSDEAEQMHLDSSTHFTNMLPHMKLMQHIWDHGGMPIMGNGDVFLLKKPNFNWRFDKTQQKFAWEYVEYEYILAWFRFAISRGILGGIGFFQHTPEITLAMLNEPELIDCYHDRVPGILDNRSVKYQIYHRLWPEFETRPKYNGAELIWPVCDRMAQKMSRFGRRPFTKRWLMDTHDFKAMIDYDSTSNT